MGGKGTCPPLDGRQPHTPDPLSPLPPCSAFPSGGLTPPDAPALLPLGRRDANRTASPPRRRDAPASRARAGVRWPRPRPPTLAFRELRPLLSVASRSRRSGGALLSVRQSARRGARVTAAVLPEPRGPAELPAAVSEPLSPVSSRSPSPRAVAAGAAHAEGGAGRGGPRRRRKLPGCARAGLRGWGRLGGVRWVPFLPSLRLFAPPMAAWALETAAGAAGGAPKVVGAAGLRERAAGGGPLQRGRALGPRAPREAVPSVPSALCPPRARGVTARRAARFAPPPPCRHRLAFSVARGGGNNERGARKPSRSRARPVAGCSGNDGASYPSEPGAKPTGLCRKRAGVLCWELERASDGERRHEYPAFLVRARIAFVSASIASSVPPWGCCADRLAK